jgi:hypothetical protein
MSLEAIYADLYGVAKHRGPLDEDAVRRATAVLALPRYARAANPAALLVEDLKRVIAAIPDAVATSDEDEDAHDEAAAEQRSSVAYMGKLARRYFSLEAVGDTITDRRIIEATRPPGSTVTWRNRGVVYRVIAGLLELQVEVAEATAVTHVASELSYRVDSVRLTRETEGLSWYPRTDTLEYDICLLASGPHLLVLPFPPQQTKLVVVASERPSGYPQPQLVRIADDGDRAAAVVFGAQQPPGERVRIQVEHRRRSFRPLAQWRSECISYQVSHPVGELVLQLRIYGDTTTDATWGVTARGPVASDAKTLAQPVSGIWGCTNPEIGKTYTLFGVREADSNDGMPPEE